MAFDAFLRIHDIVGDSTDETHAGWIELLSFSWGLHHSGTAVGGGGGGAGKATPQDAQFVSIAGAAAPQLFASCVSGKHHREAILSVVRVGPERREFYTWRLSDVVISSYRTAGDAGSDEVPADQFSLDFRSIEFSYLPTNPDGSAGTPVRATWDFAENRP